MGTFVVKGGKPLSGMIEPQGAKNEALQILCAVLLSEEKITIENVPDIKDVNLLIDLLDGISAKGPIIGLNVVELAPKNDINQISMIGAGRFIVSLVMREVHKKQLIN